MNDTAKLQKLFFICKIFLYYFPITTRKFFHTMKGIDLKTEIKRQGKSITEVAEALWMSQQNLNSALSGDNIKTGTLERVAEFLGKPISFFYNEGNVATVGGDGYLLRPFPNNMRTTSAKKEAPGAHTGTPSTLQCPH